MASTHGTAPDAISGHSNEVLMSWARKLIQQYIQEHPKKTTPELHEMVRARINEASRHEIDIATWQRAKLRYEEHDAEIKERGYWLFYHEKIESCKDVDPDRLNQQSINFFYNALRAWKSYKNSYRSRFHKRAKLDTQRHPTPILSNHVFARLSQRHDLLAATSVSNDARAISGGVKSHRLNEYSVKALAKCLETELCCLEQLQTKLSASSSQDQIHFLEQVKAVLDRRSCPDSLIAVFGVTGAGKSSTLNALLGHVVLPESSQGACTPFVTVVKYGGSTGPGLRIRLTITYVDRASWLEELEKFYSVLHASGNQANNLPDLDDYDAGTTGEKIRVMHPDLQPAQISQMCPEDLLELPCVSERLGKNEARTFSQDEDVRTAIDELILGASTSRYEDTNDPSPRFWPIVKTVEIEINNDLLKQGISFVDLPGVHDVNKARASVAETYLKKCSVAWIVTPIIRACDEASANRLLSAALEQRLHIDGLSLNFVCTKTDEIGGLEQEAKRLRVSDQVTALGARQESVQASVAGLTAEVNNLHTQCIFADRDMESPKKHLETYYKLKRDIEAGIPQQTPVFGYAGQKRKHSQIGTLAAGAPLPNAREGFVCANETLLHTVEELDEAMNIEDIETDLSQKSQYAQFLNAEHNLKRQELERLSKELESIVPEMWQTCIQARNQITKESIQRSYSQSLAKFQRAEGDDQKSRATKLEENEAENAAATQDLPIFMISSKAYKQLRQQPPGDVFATVRGDCLMSFTNTGETGIPQLIEHSVKQARAKRRVFVEALLNKIWKLKIGVRLWASGNTFISTITEEQLQMVRNKLNSKFSGTRMFLDRVFTSSNESLLRYASAQIITPLSAGCEDASDEAVGNTVRFPADRYRTFKAILVRDGVYTRPDGNVYNFNEWLLRPITNKIGPGWRLTINEKLRSTKDKHVDKCQTLLANSTKYTVDKAKVFGCGPNILQMIEELQDRYTNEVNNAADEYFQNVSDSLQDTRSGLEKSIQLELAPAYKRTLEIKGKNSFLRMKTSMADEVDSVKDTMFVKAAEKARVEFDSAFSLALAGFKAKVFDHILRDMERDFQNIFRLPPSATDDDPDGLKREIKDMLTKSIQNVKDGELKELMRSGLSSSDAKAEDEEEDEDQSMFVDED